jgi:hypothetical protein
MALGDTYRFTIRATAQNNLYENTLAFNTLLAVTPVPGDWNAIATAFTGIWLTDQSTRVLWTSWTAVQLWGAGMSTVPAECRRQGGLQFAGNVPAPNQGAEALDQMLPPQSAFVVTLLTGNTGRRKRGRWYGFGLTEIAQDAGTWTSTVQTAIHDRTQQFFARYAQGGTDPGYRLGVWSERTATGCIPNPNGKGHVLVDQPNPQAAFTPCTGFTARPIVYSQRRRTLGVGR